jgi:serine protein kinase
MKDVVKLTINPQFPNEGQQRRVNEIQEKLKEEKGYCDHCSGELVRHVGNLLSK